MKYSKYASLLSFLLVVLLTEMLSLSPDTTNNTQNYANTPAGADYYGLNETTILDVPFLTGSGNLQDPYRIQDQANLSISIWESAYYIVFSNCSFNSGFVIVRSQNILIETSQFNSNLEISQSSNINITKNNFMKDHDSYTTSGAAIQLIYTNNTNIVENSISNYTHGIYVIHANKMCFNKNQISQNQVGMRITESQEIQILENDIGNSKELPDYIYSFFPMHRDLQRYQDRAFGLVIYNNIGKIEVQNNTIHNIFGTALFTNSADLPEWVESNKFSQNLRIVEGDSGIFDQFGMIFDLYLIIGLMVSVFVVIKIGMDSEDVTNNAMCHGIIFLCAIGAYSVSESLLRIVFGIVFLVEQFGVVVALKSRKYQKRKELIGNNNPVPSNIVKLMNIFAILVSSLFIVEQVQLHSRFAIRWDADILWDWIFVVSTNLLWFLIWRILQTPILKEN